MNRRLSYLERFVLHVVATAILFGAVNLVLGWLDRTLPVSLVVVAVAIVGPLLVDVFKSNAHQEDSSYWPRLLAVAVLTVTADSYVASFTSGGGWLMYLDLLVAFALATIVIDAVVTSDREGRESEASRAAHPVR